MTGASADGRSDVETIRRVREEVIAQDAALGRAVRALRRDLALVADSPTVGVRIARDLLTLILEAS